MAGRPQPNGAPSQQGTMWPQESQRWCEVSQRMAAPQRSQGARPPMSGPHASTRAVFAMTGSMPATVARAGGGARAAHRAAGHAARCPHDASSSDHGPTAATLPSTSTTTRSA